MAEIVIDDVRSIGFHDDHDRPGLCGNDFLLELDAVSVRLNREQAKEIIIVIQEELEATGGAEVRA